MITVLGTTIYPAYLLLLLAVWLIGGALVWMGVYAATSRKSGG